MQPFIPLPTSPRSGIYRCKVQHLFFFCLLAVLLFSLETSAQNLVNNPSFESKIKCPIGTSDISDQLAPNCAYWFSANTATPDYFHSCTQATVCGVYPYSNYIHMVSVPQNTFGYQNAFDDPADPSDTQNAYAGIVYSPSTVNNGTNNRREYIEVPLTSKLEHDQLYEVSFYVSLADGSSYALTDLGAYLSPGAIIGTTPTVLSVLPQIHDTTQFFTDKDNWVQIRGIYKANGGENYLTIGYFRNTLNSGTDYITVPIDATDTSCYAKALPDYDKFAYYYIDNVSVSLICRCGKDAYTVTPVADTQQPVDGECCYKLNLTREEGACDIGSIRVNLLPIVVSDASFNSFTQSYSVLGNWSKNNAASSLSYATWTRNPNLTPQQVGTTETFAGFCLKTNTSVRSIVIQYLDDEMNYMCADTLDLPICYLPNCCDSLELQIDGAAEQMPDRCCFFVRTELPELCDEITSLKVTSLTNEPIFLLSDTGQAGSPTLTFGRFTLEGQEFVGGYLCVGSDSISSFGVSIQYLNAEGTVICSIDTTLKCNCCVSLRTFKGDMCTSIPEGTDAESCCRGIYITRDAGSDCKVYGVVITNGLGGVELQSNPIVFPPSGASGSQLQCYGYYCLSPGETRTILVDFLDSLGYVFCTKAITDTCDERSCCDSISLGFEFPFYPPWNVPDQCCASIYAVQPSDSKCKVYGINVINAQGGISYDPNRQVSLPNCGNCVRTIIASYCLEPGETRTITIEFIDISGNVMCTKTIVRSCPAVDSCCNKLKAEFIPTGTVNPQQRCCMDIKISKQPGLNCDVYGIRLTGASGGVALQSTPIVIPTGNPSNPNVLTVGRVCCPYGQSRTVTVEFLDATGSVLCSKTISFSCSSEGVGEAGKTGASSGADVAVPRLLAMPNPTAGITTIEYDLSENTAVRLELYNSLGKLIAVPEEGFRTIGQHTVIYTTDALPSGVYYLKLTTGENVLTIPLVVTKK